MRKSKKSVICFDFLFIIVLILIDQFTKRWAENYLKVNGPIELIKGALEFYYLPEGNRGAAFGMLQGHQILFLIIALVVVSAIVFLLTRIPLDKRFIPLRIMLVFIAAGGLGNMIDRAVLDYVIDFVYFSLINFPIFNVADIYVSVSTVLLALFIIFYYKEDDLKILEKAIKNIKD